MPTLLMNQRNYPTLAGNSAAIGNITAINPWNASDKISYLAFHRHERKPTYKYLSPIPCIYCTFYVGISTKQLLI